MLLRASSLLLLSAAAFAQNTVVSPVATATVEGNSNNAFPWNSSTVRRYTQIHSDLTGTPRNSTKLAVRQNAGTTTNYTGTWACDLEMYMGDSVDWDRAGWVFANNYLGPRTAVFARRVINLGPMGQNATTGPLPFTVDIPLDAPHAYVGVRSLLWEALIHANTLNADNTQNDAATCAASPFLTGWIAFVDTNQSGQRDAGEAILLNHEPMNPLSTARSSIDEFRVTYLLNGFALNPNAAQLVLCDERGNEASSGELSSARGILVSVTGRAGVTRNPEEIQALLDDINQPVGGCET